MAIVYSSPILGTLMREGPSSSETWFLQEPDGETFQKTAFFRVIAMKKSNLTN
jgi:hypothetical protein